MRYAISSNEREPGDNGSVGQPAIQIRRDDEDGVTNNEDALTNNEDARCNPYPRWLSAGVKPQQTTGHHIVVSEIVKYNLMKYEMSLKNYEILHSSIPPHRFFTDYQLPTIYIM